MTIIDVHAHLGDCRVFDTEITEAGLLQMMEDNNITAAVVQPLPGASDYREVHERIYRLTQQYPGKFYGLISINPHKPKDELESEIKKYAQDYGFVGIKLHTQGHAVHPHSRDAYTLYELAAKYNLVVNVHTGLGIPFAMPALLLPVAKQYPQTKFVVAHSGTMMFANEAVILAQECPNVYLDTTMCVIEDLLMIVRSIGTDRLMYATDSLKSAAPELGKFRAAGLTEDQLKDVLYRNAAKVFGLQQYLKTK